MLITVNDLAISYGANVTVADVNFELDRGQILAIVGESGSGKTSVIRAIMGCLPGNGYISKGQIIYDGRDLCKNTREDWRRMSGRDMSMIFQDSGSMINPIRRIGNQFVDYIKTHDATLSTKQAKELAKSMLLRVGLPNPDLIMRNYPFELSGGMRQRIGIAMAMTFSPKLLLADEPTSALDVTMQAQIVQQIVTVRDELEAAVIVVTHNLGVAAYMSDMLMVMKQGRVVESGATRDVLFNPQHAYTKELLHAVPTIGGRCFYDAV